MDSVQGISTKIGLRLAWERGGEFRNRPLCANGLLITQRENASNLTFFNVAMSLNDGSAIWEVPSSVSLQKRVIGDENNFYYIGYDRSSEKHKVISVSIKQGTTNWVAEFDDLISKLFFDGRMIIALGWFKNIDGINVYTMNSSNGKIVAKNALSVPPKLSLFWFAQNGDIVALAGAGGVLAPGTQILLFSRPYSSSTVLLQGNNIKLFEGISSYRCFYSYGKKLGMIDLKSKQRIWEIESDLPVEGLFEAEDKVVAFHFDVNSSTYTRFGVPDGKLLWQTKDVGTSNSRDADDGAFVRNYFVTGGWVTDVRPPKSRTIGIDVDDGQIVLSIERGGGASEKWAVGSGDLIYVHTSDGIAAVSLRERFVYVSDSADDAVSVVDTSTNAVTATVPVGRGPQVIAMRPGGGKYAYVTNFHSSTVSVIDTDANKVVSTINVAANPSGVVVTPDGKRAYVANSNEAGTVSVIDTSNNTVVTAVAVGDRPLGVAAGNKYVYVANSNSGTVSAIDAATNTVAKTIKVGLGPQAIAVTPDGNHAYVTNSGANTVSVIDTVSNTVTATVDTGTIPFGLAVTPDGRRVYVANAGDSTVSVIDTATSQVTTTALPSGSGPQGLAISQGGSRAYVANFNSNSVSVIDLTTNTVMATVGVGTGPSGVGMIP
jgi:YVTN family beta-propeller protein